MKISKEVYNNIIIGITIAVFTSLINYFFFLRQFSVSKTDRKETEMYDLMNRANEEFDNILSKETDATFLDYFFPATSLV